MIQSSIRYVVILLLLGVPIMGSGQSTAQDTKDTLKLKGITFPHVHDPVMAKEGDTYYVYGTGVGISTWYSKDLVHWKKGKPVFDSLPNWVHHALPHFQYSSSIWAPDIIHYQGLWYLFYACNQTPGKPDAAIGLATNPTLDPDRPDYKWTDRGKMVQSVLGRDMWQAIDPNAVIDKNGQPWLAFGSFWDGIKLVKMTDDMMQLKWPQEWHTIARRPSSQKLYEYGLQDSQIEAAFIFQNGDYYYLFASVGICCRGINGTYHVVVGRSKNITGPYVDKAGFSMMDGNGNIIAVGDGERWAAVGHNSAYHLDGKDYFVVHGYSIPDHGDSKLIVSEIKWDKEGWPIIHLPKLKNEKN